MSISRPMEGKNALLNVVICQRPQLLAIARRILRCPHLAEDVIQDAAVKASHMRDETSIGCPEQFARRMVKNLAIDQARRRSLECRYAAPEADGETMTSSCADPCARLEVCEAMNAVLAALEELPARTRHVFERARIEGVSQKCIAADLGVSPTLVNFMVQAAHRHCFARLQEHEQDDFTSGTDSPSLDHRLKRRAPGAKRIRVGGRRKRLDAQKPLREPSGGFPTEEMQAWP
ncbi:sigma-70 family RNA polymerase sigma factor [Methylocapsa aurea]|uniref:sigma-70 family RNA polymerase sigma factor n=1 Tax=Methylocapsa aurea TaxID=663610 RepID=UPI000A075472|nr:sigma-70 family RNA polymerase sigma factor [Methylocapsa aurea]